MYTQYLDGFRAISGHCDDDSALRDRRHLVDKGRDVFDEISLVQHDDGRRTAVPRRQHVAFDAPRVEVLIETRDEKHDVDVGGDDLLLRRITRRATREV